MAHLFSPLTIARIEVPNRIVMASAGSGYATIDGFVDDALMTHYAQAAQGGVGMIITEPLMVVSPPDHQRLHLGLYDDVFVPQLRRAVTAVKRHGARFLAMLDAPIEANQSQSEDLHALVEQYTLAAWRALAAGCDGVMLNAADRSLLHTLVSPLSNQRGDAYGGTLAGRLRLPLAIVECTRKWLGRRFIIGVRIVAEEFAPGGMVLQDARVFAKRLVAAGVNLLDITVDARTEAPLARFPGWCIPLANGIKRVIPDAPVIGSGLLGDPLLADSLIRENSIDLVMLRKTLHQYPNWPQTAYDLLMRPSDGAERAPAAAKRNDESE